MTTLTSIFRTLAIVACLWLGLAFALPGRPTDWVSHQDQRIGLKPLGEGKFLVYDTQDVIFYLPFSDELVDWMGQPDRHRVFSEEPGDWSWMNYPAYMAQWTHLLEDLEQVDHVDATGYDLLALGVYVYLGRALSKGEIHIYDKEQGAYLDHLFVSVFAEPYACDCYGEPVSGVIHHQRFYATTPQTAFLYFYMQQDRMVPDCCMEEFPLPEESPIEKN